MFRTLNPATESVVATFDAASPARIEQALDDAVAIQRPWSQVPIAQRAAVVARIGEVLLRRKETLSQLITLEMGKPIVEAEAEIEKSAATCGFYAANAAQFLADEPVASATGSQIVYDPLGVVLAVMPWNYPIWQFIRFAAPALCAGNGIILKHAGNVPQCALAINSVFADAGVPPGLAASLLIQPENVAALISDSRIAAVTLTGSTAVGKLVASQAGAAMKKQVLELGGSDPFIVLADADVERAAQAAVKARFSNTGQSCISSKRFIVDAAVADRFVELFCAGVAQLKVGAPTDRSVTIGPLARANLRDELHRQVELSVAAGAVLKTGGQPLPGQGFFYAPTVLDHVTPDMVAAREETFGPVAAVMRVKDTDAAIALANDTEFGLGAALWTADLTRAQQLVRKIEAGAVFVNSVVASDARLPFGGIKQSGYGRELGAVGMREFTNIKTVWINPALSPIHPQENIMTIKTPSGAALLRPEDLPRYDRGGGASTTPLVGKNVGSASFITGYTSFEPGMEIPFHSHNCEESVVLVEGDAILDIDGLEYRLKPLDTTFIPPNVPHRFRNMSKTNPMKILWIYARLDATRTLVASGETRPVSAEHQTPSP